MRTANARHSLVITLLLCVALDGCGSSGEKNKTQVVARVNGEEITVSQLNQVLGMMGPEAVANPAEASNSALENIIDTTIGVQAALKMKLDRDPETLQAVEAAKRHVLVEAYLDRVLQKTASPTSSEVHEYFSQHPELFANRRIYVFNQVTARAGKESISSLNSTVASIGDLSELVIWLKKHGVEYNLVSDVKPSEQLPMGMLAEMQKLKVGDLGYWSATDGVVVMKVLQVIERPLTEQEAQPLIGRYLVNRKQMMAEQELFKEMRASARVEYLGEFKSAPPVKHAVPPQAAKPPRPFAPEKPKPPLTVAGYTENGLKWTPISKQQDTGGYLVTP